MKKILIVDDDRDFADGIAEIIDEEGYESFLAYSGQEALQVIQKHDIDVVFLDIRMPQMDGVEAVKEIRKLKPDIRVAMLTGYYDQDMREAALDNGASDVLHKPIDVDDLLSFIEANGLEEVILLVDDDEDFSDSIKSTLMEHGYKVFIARDGPQAIEYVLHNKVSLMLLDLRLPDENGIDIYNKLNEQGKAPPAFVVTAYAEDEYQQIERLKSLSIKQVFQKPFNPEDLIKAIENVSR